VPKVSPVSFWRGGGCCQPRLGRRRRRVLSGRGLWAKQGIQPRIHLNDVLLHAGILGFELRDLSSQALDLRRLRIKEAHHEKDGKDPKNMFCKSAMS
jgi:hypothetical protein